MILLQILTYAGPVLFAALGAVLSERSGVLNIGLEGLMLTGCLVAVAVCAATGQPYLGAVAAACAAATLGALFGLFGVVLRRDQVIVGTTINFLALGLTGVLYRAWTSGGTAALTTKTLPVLLGDGAGGINLLTMLALLLVPTLYWLLFRTRLGVTMRAAGEKPAAAAAAGTSIVGLRLRVCVATGFLCGLGGAALSIGISNTFIENMTGGRGFVALAAVVFGRWTPGGVLLAALLFAAADVGQGVLQARGLLPGVPYPVFLALPYLLTLVALAVRGANVQAPAALGEPFEQG
jgi:simple sugar transport system permease protein